MASGGSRNRSGPKADLKSGRSDRRNYSLTALPSEGFDGTVPEFPLPNLTERELEVWSTAWRTPQACAWSLPSERWRIRLVAMWTRISVRCEDPEAPASLIGQLHRFEDKIGFSTAGLAEMGWVVAVDQIGAKSAGESGDEPKPKRERRLRTVGDDK